ncbi:hypothetical protein DKZ27_11170 [Limosilactobacillus reuteri]|uniref:Uncharacterized protein n=1 Tax=Limosilactobacillus reuteri TaxID=1598 RepID=A0AAW8ZWW4_LIMRT|nr:hypothetical protein [Limosilactobacillus reuteri]MDV8945873.1 hypothetical protein [Limosilactobacillus reuteri]PWT29586.1 hypothetical protein DKZ27_11170 [Limosilactobacillus reuteri]PWT40196.1 hypothetical protein DKZ34_06455 [Limosilactobacillus reuteri]
MKLIKENWLNWLVKLLIIAILFVPQYYVWQQNWQTKGIFGVLSIAVVIFVFNSNIRELFIGSGGVSLKMKELSEDTATVRELGLDIMKAMLIMMAFDDNSLQGLTPVQKINVYHNLLKAKKKLVLHDEELDNDFIVAQKSIIRGFVNSFRNLQLEENDIISFSKGNSVIHFDTLRKAISGIQNETNKDKYQNYYDYLVDFTKEINF